MLLLLLFSLAFACTYPDCYVGFGTVVSSCTAVTSQGLCIHSYQLSLPGGQAQACHWPPGTNACVTGNYLCTPTCRGSSFAGQNCNQETVTTCEGKYGLNNPDEQGCYFSNCFYNYTTLVCSVTTNPYHTYACNPYVGATACTGTRTTAGCSVITSQSVCTNAYVKNNAGYKAQCGWDTAYGVCYESKPCW